MKPSDASLRAGLELAAEAVAELASHATTVDADRRDVIARITWECSDGIKAAAPSTGGGRMWCWAHQRELAACHRDGEMCRGETLTGTSDPTGEAAIVGDPAARDRAEAAKAIKAIARAAEKLADIFGRYPAAHAPTLFDLELTDGCQSCARIGVWSQVHGKVELSPGEVRRLCHWCGWDWFPRWGELPSLDVVQAHNEGGRISVNERNGDVVWRGQVIDRLNIRAGQRA